LPVDDLQGREEPLAGVHRFLPASFESLPPCPAPRFSPGRLLASMRRRPATITGPHDSQGNEMVGPRLSPLGSALLVSFL
jgi:hypothetical protein